MQNSRLYTILRSLICSSFLLSSGFLASADTDFPPDPKLVLDSDTGLSVPEGFDTELLYKVDRGKYGSWISMTFDNQGRLVVSDQDAAGTFLIEVPEIGKTLSEDKITKLGNTIILAH